MTQGDSIHPSDLTPAAAARIMAATGEIEAPCPEAVAMPDRIPGYVISERLGLGGGGVVYRGYRAGSERPLAIKLLTPRIGRETSGGKRAWRELELLEQLRLPALPRMIDYGIHDGRLYIATEFVEGLPLDRHCEGNRLDRRRRVELLAQVADVVHSLHEHGVIHRDIKPSNILIDAHGQPVIIDLGIATLLAADVMETLTADGAPIGSPAFMSPEQARGERERISTRSDVYGLGATAYLVLTGRTPHDTSATLHEVIRRVAQDPPRRARELEPSLPKPLAAVLEKAVAAVPEGRYASAASFAADLRRWLLGEPVIAARANAWSRTMRWVSRHPVAATASGCIVVAALSLVATVIGVRITVHALMREPVSIVKTREAPYEIQLKTRAGNTVASWPYEFAAGDRIVGETLERTDGRRVVVVYPGQGAGNTQSGVVSVWDMKTLNVLWSTPSENQPLTTPGRPGRNWDLGPGDYSVRSVLIADVFPSDPGPELVVGYTSPIHPSPVRVFDLYGKVLYEAWHPGSIGPIYWLCTPGLILAVASCGEASWAQAGYSVGAGQSEWPGVIWALKPEPRTLVGWVWGPERDTRAKLAWYKFLSPYPAYQAIEFRGWMRPTDRDRWTTGAELHMFIGDPSVGFSWTLDGDGSIVSNTDNDAFVKMFGAESPNKFRLVDSLNAVDRRIPIKLIPER